MGVLPEIPLVADRSKGYLASRAAQLIGCAGFAAGATALYDESSASPNVTGTALLVVGTVVAGLAGTFFAILDNKREETRRTTAGTALLTEPAV